LFSENASDGDAANPGFGLVRVDDGYHWQGTGDDFEAGAANHDPGTIDGAIEDLGLTLIGVGYWTNNEDWTE